MFSHVLHPIHCRPSPLARVDPRARIVAAVAMAIAVAVARGLPAMAFALAVGVGLVAMARISLADLLRRIWQLELLVVVLAIMLPWPVYGRAELILAAAIALKSNAAVLAVTALIGTMDAVTLGHALAHLRVPQKLVQLLLFMVRYLDVLGKEFARLRAAMRVRCFRPGMNGHTYRAIGYLVGMMLVRSFDRSERVLAAMKCRGFRGRYYLLDHFSFLPCRDGPFCVAIVFFIAILIGLEWI